ncbi:MAG: hypothetical protein Fur005_11840 [Roseiflexaceae bacterium]
MATIFPNNPVGVVAPEILRIFRLIKRLPDTYAVWMHLVRDQPYGPHFWILRNDGRSILVCVAMANTNAVRNTAQHALFGEVERPGAHEQQALSTFLATLHSHGLKTALPGLIAFPGVATADLQRHLAPPPTGMQLLGQEDLTAERFQAWLEQQLSHVLTLAERVTVRRHFTPEVIIPPALTVRQAVHASQPQPDRDIGEYVLSFNQEWVLKHDLDLNEEGQQTSEDLQVRLVSGVAGSGKSLILLYRARLLRQFFPQKRVLILTHNRPLINDLQHRYRQLAGPDALIEWRTFLGWCHKYWPANEPRANLIRTRQRSELIRQIWHRLLADTTISPDVLQDEIDWIKDRLITTREEYLAADRSGRGFRLAEGMRVRVFEAARAYQQRLAEQHLIDYGDVPRRIWRGILEQRHTHPQYDFVLIDEAQFFAPIWFEILKRSINARTGYLFMVADPTQGFMKRKQSWLASGIDVRGHSHRLERCYRTTPAIIQYAATYYQQRLPGDEEAIIAADLQASEAGAAPLVVGVPTEQDELTRVVSEVRALVQTGVPLDQILIIHASWLGAKRLRERLQAEFGQAKAIDPRNRHEPGAVRVCTLNAATGLESPIVFLVGTHQLYEQEQSVRLSPEERHELLRDNTRRLYMAMTRAGQRLVITYAGNPPAALITQ